MPTYVTLWKYTGEGLKDIRNTTSRFEAVKKIIESNGGKLLQVYGLIGEYDVLTITEMPDNKALASTVLRICASGRIGAETLEAIPIEEFLKITQEV